MYYVYLHIKETDGMPFYIGKGKDKRAYDLRYRNDWWYNIVNKHGFDVIILENDLTEEEAFLSEIYWIDRIGRRDLGNGTLVNLTDGGEGTSNRFISDEFREKCSVRMLGNNINYGRKCGDVTKEKLSIANSGCNNYMYGKESAFKGKKHTNESKKKISDNTKGLKRSLEYKEKFKELRKNKYWKSRGVMLLDLETGIFYDTIKEASQALNIKNSTLVYQIKNNSNKKFKKLI